MEILKLIFRSLAYVALAFTLVEAYLSLNKLWKRKHELVVAESISISAVFIGIFSGLIYSIEMILSEAWTPLFDQVVWLLFAVFQLFVAIGFWVKGQRTRGVWSLIKSTFQQDRDEAGDLAKAFMRPSGAKYVLEILTQMAIIDQDLDKKEKKYINHFARDWNLKIDWDSVYEKIESAKVANMSEMRTSMEKYLETSPPKEQVNQLIEVLNVLVKLDDDFSENEQLILSELEGLRNMYIDDGRFKSQFFLALVPQDKEQEDTLVNLFPNLEKRFQENGAFAYWDGPFYSPRYAQTIAEKYDNLHIFSVVVEEPVD